MISPPKKGSPEALGRPLNSGNSDPNVDDPARKINSLPPGKYPGFSTLPSKVGVYRAKLRPETNKADPNFSDYRGIILIGEQRVRVNLWVHTDGTLGLRLEKITKKLGQERSQPEGRP